MNVIAEFKRRSPSRGVIREDLAPGAGRPRPTRSAGAAALSVLTEEQFFGGSLEDLQEARAATLLPALRKDFIVDPYQVWEALARGRRRRAADRGRRWATRELRAAAAATAREAGLDALVEVHDRDGAASARCALAPRIVGVNNRNLRTWRCACRPSLDLAAAHPGRRGGGGGERDHAARATCAGCATRATTPS